MAATRGRTARVKAFGMKIEVERRGTGKKPLVIFYDEEALTLESPVLDALARSFQLIIVSPPGFGLSERPDWIETIADCAYICMDVLDALKLKDATVMGFGVGGWLAAEIAVKSTHNLARLVLVDPFGIKVGGPFDRDIQDIWFLAPDKLLALKYADTEKGRIDYTVMPEKKLEIIARNKETYARFCWQPYMHNPKLRRRLHRIDVPTLVVWGDSDGIITPAYGRAFAKEIPDARFATVTKAGHFPHIEQPDAFLKAVGGFIGLAKGPARKAKKAKSRGKAKSKAKSKVRAKGKTSSRKSVRATARKGKRR
ncbi:MAG: alpha/beta fold hydrolase [Alphaproteobacteria bacterium]